MKKGTVLVVDDDKDTTDLYSMVLMSKGHNVLVATNITQAIELAYKHKVDVLLTDLYLGDGMGDELVKLLGKKKPSACILVTGKDPLPSSRYPDFEDYLIKPVDPELLVKTVQNCINLHENER